jgi:CRISPR-associated endonuclease/helicase Cas3
MMVTFVCECEKKALIRTRRVLDAFANRIGSRTWQTVITEEGLQAVKKLLRKTATKNTAVACHWIRSRSRSELIWIVGNKDQFNEQGIVPVNYTDGELIMDQIAVNTEAIYANTKQQPLDQHLFAVGYVAYQIIKDLIDDETLAIAAFFAGCLHDIGKIDPGFQKWLVIEINKKIQKEIPEEGQHIDKGKFTFEKHPRHNEISLLLYYLFEDVDYKKINSANKDRIKHVLYWHHAKPIRKNEFKSLETIHELLKGNVGDPAYYSLISTTKQIICSINAISADYSENTSLIIEGLLTKIDDSRLNKRQPTPLPLYKPYSESDKIEPYKNDIKQNALDNLIRTAVISADRKVSNLSALQLSEYIEQQTLDKILETKKPTELIENIQICLKGFEQAPDADEKRNKQQSIAAQQLAETEADVSGVKVLQGPAGCGKTKIALEWAARTEAKQIIWICPRVQVCQGLVNDLTSNNYLPTAKIEINTGEFKTLYQHGKDWDTPEDEVFSGDIVITTIDQITNTIVTHRNVTSLVDYMNAHVVFDEYHEYINMPAFNLLFAELIECKAQQKEKAKALLISATPNYYFIKEFLDIDAQEIISIPSFNHSTYKISFIPFDESKQDKNNPLYQKQPENTFVISNTALTAQKSFINNQQTENAILLHSKFKKSDKKILFEKIIENFKQNGTYNYDLLRSGPIVQASLNISSQRMVTEFTYAENWLQRLGRLNRFGEHILTCEYITAIPENLAVGGKQQSRCARFLNSLSSLQSAKAWYEFLQDKLEGETTTLAEMYALYEDFYRNQTHLQAIEQDFISALKKSVKVIRTELIDPITLPRKSSSEKIKNKVKAHSLRGESRYVQMAICKVNGLADFNFENRYACDLDDSDSVFTMSVEEIQGYDESGDKNLISFMHQKHHKIMTIKSGEIHRQVYKSYLLKKLATEPETPIFLSYTDDDLNLCNDTRHPHAIYYAIGINQPIGAISINTLNSQEEE